MVVALPVATLKIYPVAFSLSAEDAGLRHIVYVYEVSCLCSVAIDYWIFPIFYYLHEYGDYSRVLALPSLSGSVDVEGAKYCYRESAGFMVDLGVGFGCRFAHPAHIYGFF